MYYGNLETYYHITRRGVLVGTAAAVPETLITTLCYQLSLCLIINHDEEEEGDKIRNNK